MATPPIDLTALTDDELSQLNRAVFDEQSRRQVLATTQVTMAAMNEQYMHASGVQHGDDWGRPTGAHNTYPKDWVVTHNGKTWTSLVDANVWEPGVANWRENVPEGAQCPEWVQPSGAHDAYNTGDCVTLEGTCYVSVIDANVWSPADYPAGWDEKPCA